MMIGSRRDNDLANYREDHCQEEQGNGTVHLSMTIMPVKNIVNCNSIPNSNNNHDHNVANDDDNEKTLGKYLWQY